MSDILEEFAIYADRALRGLGKEQNWRRLRIAVTPLEHAKLMEASFDRGKDFYGCVRGVKFVVEDNPSDETICITMRPSTWNKP